MASPGRPRHAGVVTSSDEEVIDLLHEFCAAFAEQDPARLRAAFVEGNVCFVASDGVALHDRAHLQDYFDEYAAQPVSFSFEWDACQVSADDRSGWIVAFGREVRHEGEGTRRSRSG